MRARLRSEEGSALIFVLALSTLLLVISVTVISNVNGESTRSRLAAQRDASFQAAEAGIDDYIAKLLSDPAYYAHEVHPAEATRRATDGSQHAANTVWSSGMTWTYTSGKNAWRVLGNGYEYNLEITSPTMGTGAVGIISTGRPVVSSNTMAWRVISAQIRPSLVSDFQMMADSDISYGSGAVTYGKVYVLQDAQGVKHNLNHSGTAQGDLFAEGRITGSTTMQNGAKKYDSTTNPSVRTMIKNPINFGSFLSSIVDVQNAAANGGLTYNTSGKVWRLTFNAAGTVTVQSCSPANGDDPAQTNPSGCSTVGTPAVPANGAIYTAQTAVVSGTVNGRVTVASAGDIVISNNLYYNDKHDSCAASGTSAAPADDILGLDASNDIVVAGWAPSTLKWCAATIAQNGSFHSYLSDGSHSQMTFIGSTATEAGGQMAMFDVRDYYYDDALLYLQPPWFPLLGGSYTVFFERELPASS